MGIQLDGYTHMYNIKIIHIREENIPHSAFRSISKRVIIRTIVNDCVGICVNSISPFFCWYSLTTHYNCSC